MEHALKLNPTDKFMIIEALLNSLDEPDKNVDEIWAIEAEKRLEAYKAGKLKILTYDKVFGLEVDVQKGCGFPQIKQIQ